MKTRQSLLDYAMNTQTKITSENKDYKSVQERLFVFQPKQSAKEIEKDVDRK